MGNKVQWLYGASTAVLLAIGCITPAKAQNATQAFVVTTCGTPLTTLTAGKNGPVMENVTGQLCVNASVSASITGFPTVQSTGTPIAVTTGGVTGTLPTGAVVVASNVGATNGAYCKLGASATTSDQLIPPNSWFAFTVGANTQLACITSTSTTTVNMVGGSGLPTGSGGGGGGSGGATNITQVGGVNVPTSGGLQSGALPIDASTSSQLHTDLIAPVVAGTARIGYVSDDPCNSKIKLNAPFSTSSGGPVSLIALSGSTVIYVCSISAITDTAIKLSFIDGTGGSCAAAQHAIWGSTTAASGMSLAANGGFTQGSGNGSVGVTTAASALCLLQSGTSLIAGNVVYVQQ